MSIKSKINDLVKQRNEILANAMKIDDKEREELNNIDAKISELKSFQDVKQTANTK